MAQWQMAGGEGERLDVRECCRIDAMLGVLHASSPFRSARLMQMWILAGSKVQTLQCIPLGLILFEAVERTGRGLVAYKFKI